MTAATGTYVVIDTMVWNALFTQRKPPPETTGWRAALVGRTVVIATQTRAEIMSGIAKTGGLGPARKAEVQGLLDGFLPNTIPVTEDVIRAYADLRAACWLTGHALAAKVHNADLWIAASALSIGAPVLSHDGIFVDAPGLLVL